VNTDMQFKKEPTVLALFKLSFIFWWGAENHFSVSATEICSCIGF